MKKIIKTRKKILACILAVCLVFTSGIIVSADNFTAPSVSLPISQISLTGDEDYQNDIDMPYRWSYIDDTLITNDKVSFKGYKNQGKIYLTAKNGLQSALLFVNGVNIDISQVFKNPGTTYSVDISSVTKNGTDNTIQLADFTPKTDSGPNSPMLNVKIPYPTVINGTAQSVGMDQEMLDLIDTLVENDVDYGFTAAQVAVIKDGEMVKNSAYGNKNSYSQDGKRLTDEESKEYGGKVTTDTLFDLASNSKMYATNFAIQKLATDGIINLDDKVSKYMGSEFSDSSTQQYLQAHGYSADTTKLGKDDMKIEDILHHKAGFPADPKYQDNFYDPINKVETTNKNANIYYSQDKQTTKDMICNTYLEYEPGTKNQYSDVDYMILGFIVEEATGMTLDQYVKENIYEPMGLTHTTYAPMRNGFSKNDCAATELNGNTRDGAITFNNIRTDTLQGQVHDEKAYYCMDQVSGHAGLYSTASELAQLCQLMISDGGNNTTSYFSKNMIDYFISPQLSNSTYGLGWRREGDDGYAYYFGTQSSSSTVGHTGWTGTLTVIDPVNDLVIVVLTNKINSPVVNPDKDPNDFVGEYFTSSTSGAIATMVYDAIDAYEAPSNADYDLQTSATLYQMTEEKLSLYDKETSGDEYKQQILKGAISLLDTEVTRANSKKTIASKEYAQKSLDSFIQRGTSDPLVAQYNDLLTKFQNILNDTDANTPIIEVNTNGYTTGSWTNNDVNVTLQNANQQDTVYSYSTDGGNTYKNTDGNSFTISNDTNASYVFKATSGNYSNTSEEYNIKVEKTMPTLELNADTQTKAQSQLINIETTVGDSGINKLTVDKDGNVTDLTNDYQDGLLVTENGTYSFNLTSNAGNAVSEQITFDNISDTANQPNTNNDNNNSSNGSNLTKSSSVSGNSSNTGDNFNMIPYIICGAIALAVIATIIIINKKKKQE